MDKLHFAGLEKNWELAGFYLHELEEQLEELEEMLRAIDRLLQRFLASEGASRGMLKFLSAQIPYRSKREE